MAHKPRPHANMTIPEWLSTWAKGVKSLRSGGHSGSDTPLFPYKWNKTKVRDLRVMSIQSIHDWSLIKHTDYSSLSGIPNSPLLAVFTHQNSKGISPINYLHPGDASLNFQLTLNVRGPSNLGLDRSISWLLMPRLLSSPGHQQPWYWLCRIGMSLSYLREDFNYLLLHQCGTMT